MTLSRLALFALLTLAACRGPDRASQTAIVMPARPVILQADFPVRPAQPAPSQLTSAIQALAAGFPGEVGVAVMDLDAGWTTGFRQGETFPQQSVSKLWVAMAVLERIDRGKLAFDTPVFFAPGELSVFSQPIAQQVKPFGAIVTVDRLLTMALVQSDNAAIDRLIRIAGGVTAVEDTMHRMHLGEIAVGAEQRFLQSEIAGLTWEARFAGEAPEFAAARARVAPEIRLARIEAYLASPPDGATPAATVQALAQLQRGALLSEGSTTYLLRTLHGVRTGRQRLRGALEPGWRLAHKTGTGPDFQGESLGINDVGLLTAPDGRVYAVAVYIGRTRAPTPIRLELMQGVTRAVTEHWRAAHGGASAAATDRRTAPRA